MNHVVARAVLAALSSVAVAPAFSQTPAEAPGEQETFTLDEVVVSAQKRETNLQDTPISVSVMTADALQDRQAISLASFADGSIPSLRVAPFATRSSALNIGMRGIGASGDANQPARDAGVGVYVDGVFLGRAQGLGTALYDVERIEVLKGPQGTLFGRNTEGGAISIVTKKPSGDFRLDTRLGVSNYDGRSSTVHMDLPRIGDFSFKVDGLLNRRGGTTGNPMPGEEDFNSYDKRGLRATALWQPADGFEATYAYDNSYDATTPYHAQLLQAGPYASALQLAGVSTERRSSSILGGAQRDNVGRTSGHLLVLDWQLSDDIKLKSISSYRDLKQGQFDQGFIDAISSFSPNAAFGRYSLAQVYQHQYSEELQLIGRTSQLQYVLGSFYYKESVGDDAQTPVTNLWNATGTGYTVNPRYEPLDLSQVTVDRASHAWTESVGVFGQATWTPAALDRLHLTVGGRYTKDDKKGQLTILNGAPSSLAFDDSWGRFDPMVNLAYNIGDSAMAYAKWSTGFKSGGANSRSLSYRAFGPEEVSAFELGWKSQFWGNRARLNLALFDSVIKGKQMDFYFPLAVGGPVRTVADTTNASTDGKSRGAELEFSITPVTNLVLSLNYTLTDINALQAPNPYVAGNPLASVLPLFAPKKAGSAAADYRMAFGSGVLRFHVDGNWSDGFYTSEIEQTLTDSSFVVNSRIALGDLPVNMLGGATAEFALWSRNLLDEQHLFYKSVNSSLGTYGIFNDPRTFGFEAVIRF
ncbi:MAG: TonB-dependent receptor [Steroidobacteraceae bacterium]